VKDIYYFGRRPDAPQTSPESRLRDFILQCLRCRSHRVNLIGLYDDDAGELRVAFVCVGCGKREVVKLE
jgi:hypothetical protein